MSIQASNLFPMHIVSDECIFTLFVRIKRTETPSAFCLPEKRVTDSPSKNVMSKMQHTKGIYSSVTKVSCK